MRSLHVCACVYVCIKQETAGPMQARLTVTPEARGPWKAGRPVLHYCPLLFFDLRLIYFSITLGSELSVGGNYLSVCYCLLNEDLIVEYSF